MDSRFGRTMAFLVGCGVSLSAATLGVTHFASEGNGQKQKHNFLQCIVCTEAAFLLKEICGTFGLRFNDPIYCSSIRGS